MAASILNYLQLIFQGQVLNKNELCQQAKADAGFCRQWLCHALASDAGAAELATVLAISSEHQLPEIELIQKLWPLEQHQPSSTIAAEFHQHSVISTNVSQQMMDLWQRLVTFPSVATTSPVHVRQIANIDNLASDMMTKAAEYMAAAQVYGQSAHSVSVNDVRNNSQYLVGSPCPQICFALAERLIAMQSGYPLSHAEPLILYRYRVGEQYKWHCDYIPTQRPEAAEEVAFFGQRQYTAIFYLNSAFEGGATAFKHWQLQIDAQQGSLLQFTNLDAALQPDPYSLHCGMPVLAGEKWISTLWFRTKPMWTRAGLFS